MLFRSSGRVMDPNGYGVGMARVSITRPNGEVVTGFSNGFGYFTIAGVEAGESCVISVSARRWTFDSQVLQVTDNVDDLSIFARPE